MAVIDAQWAESFARTWVSAWNAHDLAGVIAHYTEDVVFCSPFVKASGVAENGVIHGRDALRQYFALALRRFPDLDFRLRAVLSGPQSVTVLYDSVQGLLAAETMLIDEQQQVKQVWAQYNAGPAGF